jgi:UMF1 family MFS transporter
MSDANGTMRADAVGLPAPTPATRRQWLAWCSYDWANSGYPTIVTTFVLAAYFARGIAADEVSGASQWAFAMSASALVLAVASPILGAIADQRGRRKPWVAVFTVLCVVACGSMWFARPDPSYATLALVLLAVSNFAFEMAIVFYNAMLPAIAPTHLLGRISGWGWGLGYAGGLACLVIALVVLIEPAPPLFGLDAADAEPVRATALLVAAWFALFSLPFFLLTPDQPATGTGAAAAIRQGLARLIDTVRHVRRYKQIALYLLAHMIYADGLNTLFALGGIYAAVTFGMEVNEVLLFGIAINITAGAGAFAFGWVDDRIGARRTILIALACLIGFGAGILLVESTLWFWLFGLPLGLFLGPAQSASRSLMARLAPDDMRAEMFGLYALSGKATAFLGPAVFGLVTAATGSQRLGMATIIVFLAVGGGLLLLVREPAAAARR